MTSEHIVQVRALRAEGLSPKQIARTLGIRPSDAVAVLNQHRAPVAPADEQAGVRCWVSAGWTNEVQVTGHDNWLALDSDVESPGGLVCVLVARRHRHDKVALCGYLVDVHCLGVKNALGPLVMSEAELVSYRRDYFGAYGDDAAQPVPLELARQLVLGAVDYARALGFEPHEDFADSAAHLGHALDRCAIEFGRDGKPCYVEGPYDDTDAILRTLDGSVGPEGYHFVRALPFSSLVAM